MHPLHQRTPKSLPASVRLVLAVMAATVALTTAAGVAGLSAEQAVQPRGDLVAAAPADAR